MKELPKHSSVFFQPTHRSADDLDDEFVYESDTEENMLTYDDEGQSNVQISAELNGKMLGDIGDTTQLKDNVNKQCIFVKL